LGEPNNIEDKLRDKLNSREFVIKDSWQADLDSKLNAYNSKTSGRWLMLISGTLATILFSGLAYLYVCSTQTAEYSPRELAQSDQTSENKLNKYNFHTPDKEKLNKRQQKNRDGSSLLEKESENGSEVPIKTTDRAGFNQKNKSLIGTKNDCYKSGATNNIKTDGYIPNGKEKAIYDQNSTKNKFSAEDENSNKSAFEFSENSILTQNHDNPTTLNSSSVNVTPFNRLHRKDAENIELTKVAPQIDSQTNFTPENELDGNKAKSSDTSLSVNSSELNFLKARSCLLPQTMKRNFICKNLQILPEPNQYDKWQLSVLGGFSISVLDKSSFYQNTSDLESRSKINSILRPQLDFRISRLTLVKNTGIQTGISVSTYGEDISYEDYFETTSTQGFQLIENELLTLDTIYNSMDTTMFTVDSVFITITDSVATIITDTTNIIIPEGANGAKKYTYLEIPLGINFGYPITKKTDLLIQPEMSLGYLLQSSGAYFNNSNLARSNKALIFSGSLGLGLSHKLTDKLSIQEVVRIRKPFGSLSNGEVLIRKYYHLSFQLGLAYQF